MQLRQVEQELESLGTSVVVVTFEAQWVIEGYRKQTGLGWPILCDPDRGLYQAYGLDDAALARSAWHRSGASYTGLMLRGRAPTLVGSQRFAKRRRCVDRPRWARAASPRWYGTG